MDSLPNFLPKRALLTPDRTAVFFNDKSITFKELYEYSLETAAKLQGHGVQKDQLVAVLLKNHLDTIVILFALQLLGARTVVLNNRLAASELAWQLTDSQAELLILESDFSEMMLTLEVPGLKKVTKNELFSSNFAAPEIQEEIHLADICTIMYTSGTTGKPKGVLQTYGNHWWSAAGSALNLGITETDRWLCSVPLFHISGYSILMKSVIYGMPVILHEQFDVNQTILDIKNKQVTVMSVVGTMLSRIINTLEESKLPNYFRCMLLGGGPAPLPLLEACIEKEIPVFQTYGMTETASQIVTLSPEYSISKLGSAGKPLFPAQLRIETENGVIAPKYVAGDIVVKGPIVTTGYYNRPDANNEKFRDGWFYTGDVGYLDEEGFLFVLDRRSDLIISGGENIYPAEIESVLLAHEDIAEAGVTGIEDDDWGQVPAAFLIRKEGASVTAEELYEFCLDRLAKYKVPKKYYFTDELPRNAANKLLRRNLCKKLEKSRD
ncbi:o-succinylbenzoate--CoA ligase [Bacillus sp. MRMR6]|uniref:o-succinylbenzoate--CoA ligase n=1 Tax=Bacillus sp. MRMR6 TaxID=1928617 RepID=UPI000952E8FF|nr:o-succinylbenzoate--CoA ligase [Bacillus sp. MRMR6]OLS35810.1 o-succinylbenzoate--CoA ligase [Bacillus sp. MRMR6]